MSDSIIALMSIRPDLMPSRAAPMVGPAMRIRRVKSFKDRLAGSWWKVYCSPSMVASTGFLISYLPPSFQQWIL